MSLPPAYTSQPPMMPNLPSNANEHSLSSSLPPYSSQLPANHITIPPATVAALIPTSRPPPTQTIPSIPSFSQRQPQVVHHVTTTPPRSTMPQEIVPQNVQPQPQPVQEVGPSQNILPQAVIPQIVQPQPLPQPQPQPQPHLAQPLPYPLPYYPINDMFSSPTLPAGPYLGPIAYTIPPSPCLPSHFPPQAILPYHRAYPSYQPSFPIQIQPQPQMQFQFQQPMITYQEIPFRADGYPGPGSLPPGARWVVTREIDGRTMWTIIPGETRASGWGHE